jgi:hypothetical protein
LHGRIKVTAAQVSALIVGRTSFRAFGTEVDAVTANL